MGRTGINKSGDRREFGTRVGDRNYRYMEGVRIGKSGCVEAKLRGHITEFNAISSECGVLEIATYFFESLAAAGAAAAARPLAAEEVDFGQSLAIWPGAAQNKQSLLSIRCLRSAGVSLLSFPR